MTNSSKSIVRRDESIILAKFEPVEKNASHFQTEKELEIEFIELLKANGFEHLPITGRDDLLRNLRKQLSVLNRINFTDDEWKRFMNEYLLKNNDGIREKTAKVQKNISYTLKMDDGQNMNIMLLDKDNIHNNSIQVINQYTAGGEHKNRYDVSLLINGIPMVHVELKQRGVSLKEAFNQIKRYQRESFWADGGLFDFVQLFVISNGTHTKYYSNTVRYEHSIKQYGLGIGRRKSGDSYEFVSWWTDGQNTRIQDLMDFTRTFLTRRVLLAVLLKYCIFSSDDRLLAMRPYQIAALEKIMDRIQYAINYGLQGSTKAGGYVWHTTGSGKTLTSFKTAQLASEMDEIDKVVFVVDRKDLDHQTMQEYNKFKEGAADSNANTRILTEQLSKPDSKIIITTIQKLKRFVDSNKGHDVFSRNVVLIFDECHRSQFGKMHTAITNAFKKHIIFGFTGTPIFKQNAILANGLHLKTTQQAFGDKLHSYTIKDAIHDGNVLRFNIDYLKTFRKSAKIDDEMVKGIDNKSVVNSPKRVGKIVDYIIQHFNSKTRRHGNKTRQFNSILAVSSIESAKAYYNAFKERNTNLKVATIFSSSPNEEEVLDDDVDFDTDNLHTTSREFLKVVIDDYNNTFNTNFDVGLGFENFYKNISERMKNGEIDLLIVVNMFLTGFDAPTLNTLWIDKNLRYHGILQAFSRTNRILDSIKTYGNIVCFRGLEQEIKEAIRLFGDKDAESIVLMRTFDEYYNGWEENGETRRGYADLISELLGRFPLKDSIRGEQNEKDFIRLWGKILHLCNILESFENFENKRILTEREYQDYKSFYLDLYDKHKKQRESDNVSIEDDVEFEIELLKNVVIDLDYILKIVQKYRDTEEWDSKREDIISKVNSNPDLRSKKGLIEKFVDFFNYGSENVHLAWVRFANLNKKQELDDIIKIEKLNPDETVKFMNNAFQTGDIMRFGTDFQKVLPSSISIFDPEYGKISNKVYVILKHFFDKYYGIPAS